MGRALVTDDLDAINGQRVHQVVGMALGSPAADVDLAVEDAIARLVATDASIKRLRRRYLFISSAAAAYLTGFRPGPEWTFVGSEIRLRRTVADFVFERGKGADQSVLIDELKTVLYARSLSSASTRRQLIHLLEDGRERWGDAFVGVRLVAPALRLRFLVAAPADLVSLGEVLRCA